MAQIIQKIPNSQKSWQNLESFPFCPYKRACMAAWEQSNMATMPYQSFPTFSAHAYSHGYLLFDMSSRLPSMLYALNTTPYLPESHTSKVIYLAVSIFLLFQMGYLWCLSIVFCCFLWVHNYRVGLGLLLV